MTLKERKLTGEQYEYLLEHQFGLDKYFFEVHKENVMIKFGDLFFDSYDMLQEFIDYFFYEQHATEIIIVKSHAKGEYYRG